MAQYAILIYTHDSAHAPEATPQDTESARHRCPARDPRRRRRAAGAAGGPGPVAVGPGRAFLAGQIARHTHRE